MGRYISTMLKRRRVSVLNTSSTFSGWAPSWTCETQTSPTSCDRRGCPPCRSPVSTCWSFALDQQRIWICRKNCNSRFSLTHRERVARPWRRRSLPSCAWRAHNWRRQSGEWMVRRWLSHVFSQFSNRFNKHISDSVMPLYLTFVLPAQWNRQRCVTRVPPRPRPVARLGPPPLPAPVGASCPTPGRITISWS